MALRVLLAVALAVLSGCGCALAAEAPPAYAVRDRSTAIIAGLPEGTRIHGPSLVRLPGWLPNSKRIFRVNSASAGRAVAGVGGRGGEGGGGREKREEREERREKREGGSVRRGRTAQAKGMRTIETKEAQSERERARARGKDSGDLEDGRAADWRKREGKRG